MGLYCMRELWSCASGIAGKAFCKKHLQQLATVGYFITLYADLYCALQPRLLGETLLHQNVMLPCMKRQVIILCHHACREIKAHVPEPFWKIVMKYAWPAPPSNASAGRQANQGAQQHRKTEFFWTRGRLFDLAVAAVLYEMCLMTLLATVTEAWPPAHN
jgi:hypothetical protein